MDAAPLYLDIAGAPDNGTAHWARTADGTRIRFAYWPGENGNILILPGRAEYIEKYGRVVTRLAKRGFGAVVLDWRNQGLSDRRAQTGHVEDFAQYRQDLDAVLSAQVLRAMPQPPSMIAHSMGGLIGLGALEQGLEVRSAIFSAPMWGMGLAPSVRTALKSLSVIATMSGLGAAKVLGAGRTSYILGADPEDNSLMACADTARWVQNQLKTHPDLALGGPSWSWLKASHKEIARLANYNLPNIPTLTFLGSDETVVSTTAIRNRAAMAQHTKLVECKGARHEVLMECGDIETKVWREMDAHWAHA